MATITSNGPSPIPKLKQLVELLREIAADDRLLIEARITNAYLRESSTEEIQPEEM